MHVIVLDGNERASLAITRSLGRRGIPVSVGEAMQPCLSSSSRYCSRRFVYPSPYTDSPGFLKTVQSYAGSYEQSLLIPVTDVTMAEVLKNREQFGRGVHIPFSGYASYIALSDKISLLGIAREIGVSFPKTLFSADSSSPEALVDRADSLGYPVVIKPARSRVQTGNAWVKTGVKYAGSSDELASLAKADNFGHSTYFIQERVEGPGIGIFLLTKDGEVLASFAHRRIRENPPSGGVSVLCESVEPDRQALDAAAKLLRKVRWTGVAMVEFKLDRRDALPKLIEVNARFWGSLQLAVSSGIDFPYLLYRLALGDTGNLPRTYTAGIRSRWELGDLDHLQIRLRRKGSSLFLQPGAPSKARVLRDFLSGWFDPLVRNEILRPDDPRPFAFELKEFVRRKIRRAFSRDRSGISPATGSRRH